MYKKFSWLPIILFPVMVFLLTNCNDDNNSLGLEVQPPNDKLNVFHSDTAAIVTYSQLVDSIKTDETSLSLLGSMADPIFGVTTASFYTQFRLGQAAFSFGTEPLPDSLVLALDYEGFYGDSTSPMTVRVYELDEPILIDSVYYSQQTRAFKSTLLAEKTFIANYVDSVVVMEDTLAPHLRINLTDITSSLAIKLLNAPADSMEANSSFLNYFYGLYITAEPVNSNGSIIYFSLVSGLSGMTMYYHNLAADSLSFKYLLNSNCGRFGHFDHDYSVADPDFISQVIDKDTARGQNICYVQAMAGVKAFIRFPDIKNYYNNGKIAVNEARLFLNCYEAVPLFDPAVQLIMVKRTSDGSYTYLEDQLVGEGYFGGYYDDEAHGYWFRITATIQELMRSEETDYGYEIYLSGGSVNAQRVLLLGPEPAQPAAADSRIKLVLTYTGLN
jgi:hypothetical protein